MNPYTSGMIQKKKKKTGVFDPFERQGIDMGMRNLIGVKTDNRVGSPGSSFRRTISEGGQRDPPSASRNMYPDFDSGYDNPPAPSPFEGPVYPPGHPLHDPVLWEQWNSTIGEQFGTPPPADTAPPTPAPPTASGTDLEGDVYDPNWEDFPMPPNITPEQMEFLQNYVAYQSDMLGRLNSGESFLPEFEYPEFTDFYPEDYYERVVRDPAMSRFTETTMPNLRESMGSGFWSTARQKGEQKAMTDLDQMLLAEQAKMESDRAKSRTQWEQERAKMQLQHTSMEEKARQNYMNQMLGMLGISPFDTVVPGEDGGGLLDELAPGSQPWWLDPGGALLNWGL